MCACVCEHHLCVSAECAHVTERLHWGSPKFAYSLHAFVFNVALA